MTARRSDEPQGAPAGQSSTPEPPTPPTSATRGRKTIPLRLDPAIYEALARWAGDELRSVNAQIDITLRRALAQAGRLPREAKPPVRRGRPRRENMTGAGHARGGPEAHGSSDSTSVDDGA